MSTRSRSPDDRPQLAVLVHMLAPYRVAVHRRVAAEIPEIRVATLVTHEQADQPWDWIDAPEIEPVLFGKGQPVSQWAQPRYILRDWKKAGNIIAWLRQRRAAAVIVAGYNDVTRLRVLRWCRRHRVPVFLWGDSNILGDRATGLKRLIKRAYVGWIVRGCTGVMPCGEMGARYFARYGATPERTFLHPAQPDYAIIERTTRADADAAIAALGLDPARRRMVLCCRLIPLKRVEMALRSFAAVAAQRPDWDVLIIGEGPERPRLEAQVPPDLKHRVTFAGFVGDQARIAALLRGCDLMLVPSDFEAWSLVLFEGAAAGLALVATDVVGAAPEIIRDGVNGRIVPVLDQPALDAAVRELTDPARIDAAKAASADVLSDWRRRADPVEGIRRALRYAGVLGEDAVPRHAGAEAPRGG